jgi:hypothetical protein
LMVSRWRIPRGGLWLRWNALACGVALFIWSTPEDDRVWLVALLALWCTLSFSTGWVSARFAESMLPDGWRGLTLLAVFGALNGLLAPLVAAALMLFKDVRHAHPQPDFPPALLLGMMQRAPAWALAGGLLGLAAGLWLLSRR